MCDYSLHHVASRPAKAGDKLISKSFSGSVTRGFGDAMDPATAVCLRPGTELAFERDVEIEPRLLLWRRRRIPYRVARFRQIDMDRPSTHHDALEFPNGQVVLLTRLLEGQNATVLQMPATPIVRDDHAHDAQEIAAPPARTAARRWWRAPETVR